MDKEKNTEETFWEREERLKQERLEDIINVTNWEIIQNK